MTEHPDDESVLRDWLAVLRRQKWIVLLAVVAVPVLAFAVSHRQQRMYQASATVLISEQSPTALALNIGSNASSPPDRYAATQAALARVGAVAQMAAKAAHLPGYTGAALLAHSSVTADPTTDLLTFSVTDPRPAAAVALANGYGKQFTVYRQRLDMGGLSAAIADANKQLAALAGTGSTRSEPFQRLTAAKRELQQLQALRAAGPSAVLVGTAGKPVLVQPQTKRNVALGILLGLALGVALAFLREALDTRVRSADELRARLGMPLLAQIPTSGRRPARRDSLVTLTNPRGPGAEAFRVLGNNLEISQLGRRVRSIVMTSPLDRATKSTTVANLSVILARSGLRVILVDLDLRHPSIDRLFGLRGGPGLADVTAAELDDALQAVDVSSGRPGEAYAGMLEVLTAGASARDPGEFLLSGGLADALAALARQCDVLLIDTPPLLSVADAMAIAKHSDAVVLIAQVNQVHRETVDETRRVLEGSPARKLGIIATAGRRKARGGSSRRERAAVTAKNGAHPEPAPSGSADQTHATASRKHAFGPLANGSARHGDPSDGPQQVRDA